MVLTVSSSTIHVRSAASELPIDRAILLRILPYLSIHHHLSCHSESHSNGSVLDCKVEGTVDSTHISTARVHSPLFWTAYPVTHFLRRGLPVISFAVAAPTSLILQCCSESFDRQLSAWMSFDVHRHKAVLWCSVAVGIGKVDSRSSLVAPYRCALWSLACHRRYQLSPDQRSERSQLLVLPSPVSLSLLSTVSAPLSRAQPTTGR